MRVVSIEWRAVDVVTAAAVRVGEIRSALSTLVPHTTVLEGSSVSRSHTSNVPRCPPAPD